MAHLRSLKDGKKFRKSPHIEKQKYDYFYYTHNGNILDPDCYVVFYPGFLYKTP